MKTAGVTELVDDEIHLDRLSCHFNDDLSPVRLELPARIGLETHGGTSDAWAECSLRSNVLPQNGMAASVAFGLYLPQDDNSIPDTVSEKLVDLSFERI